MYIIFKQIKFNYMKKDQQKTKKDDCKQITSKSRKSKTNKKTNQVKKLTLAEKQAIKLKIQKERQAKKQVTQTEPKNKTRFYCTSAELQAELVKWRDSSDIIEKRIISEELGRMLTAIADKLLNRSEFRNYSKELKEDAKGYFFVKAIRGLKNYNFEFNNPFAYFTTCAWNAYITVIAKHYKHQNIKKDLVKQMMIELETYDGIDPKSSLSNMLRQYIESDEQYTEGN